MEKFARSWRLKAQQSNKGNNFKNAGIILFGIVGDGVAVGHREDTLPETNKFKSDSGAYTFSIDVAHGDGFTVVATVTGQVFFKGQDPLHAQEKEE